jgi:hypothetical protein
LHLSADASPGRIAAYGLVTAVVLVGYVGAQVWYRVNVRRGVVERVGEPREGKGEELDERKKRVVYDGDVSRMV